MRRRLFSHRDEGLGNMIHGRVRARAMSGMPKSVGLINWSKKLTVMVKIRILFGAFRCFEALARWGKCGPELLGGQ